MRALNCNFPRRVQVRHRRIPGCNGERLCCPPPTRRHMPPTPDPGGTYGTSCSGQSGKLLQRHARTSRRHVRAITGAQRYIGSQQKTPPGGVHTICSRVYNLPESTEPSPTAFTAHGATSSTTVAAGRTTAVSSISPSVFTATSISTRSTRRTTRRATSRATTVALARTLVATASPRGDCHGWTCWVCCAAEHRLLSVVSCRLWEPAWDVARGQGHAPFPLKHVGSTEPVLHGGLLPRRFLH